MQAFVTGRTGLLGNISSAPPIAPGSELVARVTGRPVPTSREAVRTTHG